MLKYSITGLFTTLLLSVMLADSVKAQSPDIDLQIQAAPVLTNAQIIELTNVLLDKRGRGSRLFSVFLQNGTDKVQENLYLSISISSMNRGLIMEAVQQNSRPFSLNPGQTLYVNNNELATGRLPGIESEVSFIGEITDRGVELLNRLQGSTRLPIDEYILEVALYQGNNRLNGGTFIESNSIAIGGDLIDEDLSLHLQAPGDIAGTGVQITNPYPEFRWEGQADQTYRVIVVEEQSGESSETLIQSAKSTAPGRVGQPASLLEFEILDLLVEGTNLQFPSSGVQPLRSGNVYYWQVFTSLQTTTGEQERASEIWSFTLGSGFDDQVEIVEPGDELRNVLIALLGPDAYRELEERNFDLQSLVLENEEMVGEMARDQLLRIAEKIREGKIKLNMGER